MSEEPVNKRKLEHIDIVDQDDQVDRKMYYFDKLQLIHRAMPEINLEDVDPSIEFMGKSLSFPLLISSMTGGDDDLLRKINRNLAEAVDATNIAMGVGSQRVMFTNPGAEESFKIRQYAPNALLFANLGAIQLNNDFDHTYCQKAIDCMDADAIFLHLNPLQEAIQPEGDCNFKALSEKIETVQKAFEIIS